MFYGLQFTASLDVCPTSRPLIHGSSNQHTINVKTPPQSCYTTRACHGQTVRVTQATSLAARSLGGCGSTPSTTAAPAAQEQEKLRRPRRCVDRLANPTGHQPAGGQPAGRQVALHRPLLHLYEEQETLEARPYPVARTQASDAD
eukprot:351882-Chlamydomonas_euryale.AAC.13